MKRQSFNPNNFPAIPDYPLKVGVGLFLILITLLGLLNHALISGMISLFFGFFFGNLRFVGFIFLIGYGLSLMINRPFIRLRWSIALLGMILVSLSVLGLSTTQALTSLSPPQELTWTTIFPTFFSQFPPLNVFPPSYGTLAVGGGILGYSVIFIIYLIGIEVYSDIILITLLIIGLLLSFELVWIKLIHMMGSTMDRQQREKEYFKKVANVKPKAQANIYTEVSQDGQTVKQFRPLFPSQNVSGLTPAKFEKPSPSPTPTVSILAQPQLNTPAFPDPQQDRPSTDDDADDTAETVSPPAFARESSPLPSPTTKRYQNYQKPPLSLLTSRQSAQDYDFNEQMTKKRLDILKQKFAAFGVPANVVSYQIGPSVTSFDIQMEEGAQVQELRRKVIDLGVALGGFNIYFKEIVPGKAVSSLEVINERASMVGYKEMMEDLHTHPSYKSKFALPFGRNITGEVVAFTPKDMIHLLVAGASGSGKTVFVHSFITSILMETSPLEARLLLIDPKRFELNLYKGMPHLLAPIITNILEARIAMERLIDEMEDRYQKFVDSETSSLEQYNHYASEQNLPTLPLIFVIIDEYNDLINVAPQISDLVQRLAQKSRAAGIHLVIATQRPTTNVITGSIKNNMATIVALRVAKQVDSVTMLGHAGAEILGGNGDMYLVNPLFARYGEIRVQGAFIHVDEINRICAFLKSKYMPDYAERFLNLVDDDQPSANFQGSDAGGSGDTGDDPLYAVIKAAAMAQEFVSMSWISRTYNTGYPRALKIFKQLQVEGIIDASFDNPNNNRGRKVLKKVDNDDRD